MHSVSIVILVLSLLSYGSGTTITQTLSAGQGYGLIMCGTTNTSLSQFACTGSDLSYTVQASQSADVYYMDLSEYQKWQQNSKYQFAFYPKYSCVKSYLCTMDWFSAMDPDKVLWVSNSNLLYSTTVVINAQTRDSPGRGDQTILSPAGTGYTPGASVYYYICGTTVNSESGRSCADTQVYYTIQGSQGVNIYWMDLSSFQSYQQGGPLIYYTQYSAKNVQIYTQDWFTASDPDKILLITNANTQSSTSVTMTGYTKGHTSSALAGWVIAVIVISIVIAMVCGAVGLAFRCGWWCWRGATQSATQDKYGNLEGRGVYPVNVQMLPVAPGSSVV